MFFNEEKDSSEIGQKVGFIFSYLIFTTALFLVLNILNKLPQSWNYMHVAGITVGITLLGFVTKRALK